MTEKKKTESIQCSAVLSCIDVMLEIKRGSNAIAVILDERIEKLEEIEQEATRRREYDFGGLASCSDASTLLYAYRNAITNLNRISEDIRAMIDDRDYGISLKDVMRFKSGFDLVYEAQIKAPIERCFGKEAATLSRVSSVVHSVKLAISRFLSNHSSRLSKFFAKPSPLSENQLTVKANGTQRVVDKKIDAYELSLGEETAVEPACG